MYSYDQAKAAPAKNLDNILIKPPSRLTSQFVMQNRLPVYVITAIPPQSNVTLTIRSGTGASGEPLRINRNKLPKRVVFSHEALQKGGRDLWSAIDKGMLVLVWPSDAEKLLQGKDEIVERQKVSQWSSLNVEKSEAVKSHERNVRDAKAAEEAVELESDQETQEPINARVMDIVSRSKAGEVKLDKAVTEFEDLSETMTERDYQYAIANVRGGKLREWLQGALAKGAQPNPAPKAKKIKVKAASDDVRGEAEMTDEEREQEAIAEAEARARQRLHG